MRVIRLVLAVACIAIALQLAISAESNADAIIWTASPLVNVTAVETAVSCASPTFCVAVGYQQPTGGVHQTFIEMWDGTSWTVSPSPDQSSSDDVLNAISCTTPTFCIAVGQSLSGNSFETLIEQWNGQAWNIIPSPNWSSGPGSSYPNELYGVSCPSSTFCEAVGYTLTFNIDSPVSQTLVETWNGTSWSLTSSPNMSDLDKLYSVACTSGTFCLADGSASQSLAEEWNGIAWSIVPGPDVSAQTISCTTPTFCMAAGNEAVSGSNETLIEAWNGTTWKVSPSQSQSSPSLLSGISCISSTACIAVGSYQTGMEYQDQALIEVWDGTLWSLVSTPNAPEATNFLNSVSCSSSGFVEPSDIARTPVLAIL